MWESVVLDFDAVPCHKRTLEMMSKWMQHHAVWQSCCWVSSSIVDPSLSIVRLRRLHDHGQSHH